MTWYEISYGAEKFQSIILVPMYTWSIAQLDATHLFESCSILLTGFYRLIYIYILCRMYFNVFYLCVWGFKLVTNHPSHSHDQRVSSMCIAEPWGNFCHVAIIAFNRSKKVTAHP